MTNSDYTALTLVVDRSGSMSSGQDEAQGGINALIADQFALEGKLSVTLSQFDGGPAGRRPAYAAWRESVRAFLNPANQTSTTDTFAITRESGS